MSSVKCTLVPERGQDGAQRCSRRIDWGPQRARRDPVWCWQPDVTASTRRDVRCKEVGAVRSARRGGEHCGERNPKKPLGQSKVSEVLPHKCWRPSSVRGRHTDTSAIDLRSEQKRSSCGTTRCSSNSSPPSSVSSPQVRRPGLPCSPPDVLVREEPSTDAHEALSASAGWTRNRVDVPWILDGWDSGQFNEGQNGKVEPVDIEFGDDDINLGDGWCSYSLSRGISRVRPKTRAGLRLKALEEAMTSSMVSTFPREVWKSCDVPPPTKNVKADNPEPILPDMLREAMKSLFQDNVSQNSSFLEAQAPWDPIRFLWDVPAADKPAESSGVCLRVPGFEGVRRVCERKRVSHFLKAPTAEMLAAGPQ